MCIRDSAEMEAKAAIEAHSPARAATAAAVLQEAPEFELTTPMLAMFFDTFRTNGRIIKSMKEWRELAFAKGWLFEFAKVVGGSGKVRPDGSLDGTILIAQGLVVVFLSHTWWDRAFVDATNDPSNPYDRGAPDWQTDVEEHPLNAQREAEGQYADGNDKQPPLEPPTKDLKHRIICAGVEKLIEEKGLDRSKVVLWCDWQCARGGSNSGPAALTSDSPRLEPLCVAGRSIRTTRWRRSKE